MAADALTRYVHYIATRVLNADELMTQQAVDRNMDGTGNPIAYGLNAIYRDGAFMNATVTLSGTVVSFAAIDTTKPMLVFCRGIWEPFVVAPIDIGGTSTLFLNYTIISTPQPDADAELGELNLSFSSVSTNGAANTGANELERNSNPIPVLTLVGGELSIVNLVYPQARGTGTLSGMVQLSTNTSEGVALATDDPAVTNARVPVVGSVVTASVYPILITGTNPDGSPKVAAGNTGGIDSKALIYAPGTDTVEGELTSLGGSIAGVVSTLTSHIGQPLGPGVHVMPNYSDVGAAPISHVGADLTVAHAPIFTADHTGFQVIRNPTVVPAAGDFAYLVQDNLGNPIAGIKHNGDFLVVNPNFTSLSAALTALYGHVSQTSHCNPHGLALTPDLIPYYPVQQGTGIAQLANIVKLGWDGAGLRATVDSTDLGDFVFLSSLISAIQAQFPCSLGVNGYVTIPTPTDFPLIVQWGQCPSNSGGFTGTQAFNPHFPHACFTVILGNVYESGRSSLAEVVNGTVNQDGFNWTLGSGDEVGGASQPYWVAFGN